MIEIKNLSKSFINTSIFKNVNLQLEAGHIYGFNGRNASGKSVLFKMICGFLKPSSGTISIDGKIIGKDIDFPDKCGIIIETPGFIDDITGFKNLKILASIRNEIDDDRIKEAMKLVGLDWKEKKSVKKYSLGMRQKLAIAQAIMENPKILILDEPMNSLDIESVQAIRQLLLSLKQSGVTILVSSHIKEDLDIMCDTIYTVKDGTIVL